MTNTVQPGGHPGDAAEVISRSDSASGCCGSAATTGVLEPPQAAPCCGTVAEAHAEGGCCGSSAKHEAVASGAGCCG